MKLIKYFFLSIIFWSNSLPQNFLSALLYPKNYFLFNGFGNNDISRKLNGKILGIGVLKIYVKKDLINQASGIPVFASSLSYYSLFLSISTIYNPIEASFVFSYSMTNIKNLKKNFALPPPNPDGKSLTYQLNNYDYSFAINYIPFSFFDNFLFASTGAVWSGGIKNHMGYLSHFYSIGFDATIFAKYSNFLFKLAWEKMIYNDEYFNSIIRAEIGLWIN
jgi:hypothetical protein